MKHLLRSILIILTGFFVIIQVTAQDQRVHTYMQAVSGQFKMDEDYIIELETIREDIMRETRIEGEGTLWMRGLKYKMVVDEYIVYFDGERLYSQNTDTEEVYVSTPDPDDPGYMQAVPMKAIKGYQQDFRYQFMGEKPFMGRERVEIQLYPKELSGPYSMLKLYIHPQTLKLEAIVLMHKEGIHYTLILASVRGNQKLDDGTFRFEQEKFPGTEVIELLD
ncbi:MAG: outer membrane lipoprotein carrier protein LolA [Bacteroidota bacterium]